MMAALLSPGITLNDAAKTLQDGSLSIRLELFNAVLNLNLNERSLLAECMYQFVGS